MRLKNARTCFGCKALFDDKYRSVCRMGFGFSCTRFVPDRPCPKPLSNSAFVAIHLSNQGAGV